MSADPGDLQVGGDLDIHLGSQHETAQAGRDVLEQVGGQQRVHRVLGLLQTQQGDDPPLRRVAGREQSAPVGEELGVVRHLSLQESGGVLAVEAQDAQEGQQGGVNALRGVVHGRGRGV